MEIGASERCQDSERTWQLVNGRAWCKGSNTGGKNRGTGRGCHRTPRQGKGTVLVKDIIEGMQAKRSPSAGVNLRLPSGGSFPIK